MLAIQNEMEYPLDAFPDENQFRIVYDYQT